MEELLGRWGMTVTAASSEAEALMMIDKSPPRLIIADYRLRGSLGTEVVGLIRSILGRDIPAVIVTADVDSRIREQIAAVGFPLLTKPVSPPRLRAMMHHLLFERRDLR
ncbi:response regulator [Bradyrhizobium sp. USDA 3311]